MNSPPSKANTSRVQLPSIHNNNIYSKIPTDAARYTSPVDYALYTSLPDTPDRQSHTTDKPNKQYARPNTNTIIQNIKLELEIDKQLSQQPHITSNSKTKTLRTKFIPDNKSTHFKHNNHTVKTAAPLLFGSSGSYVTVNDDSVKHEEEEKQTDIESIAQKHKHIQPQAIIQHTKIDVATQCDSDTDTTTLQHSTVIEQPPLKSAVLYQLYYILINNECTLLPTYIRDCIELDDIHLLYKWSQLDNSILVYLVKLYKQQRVYSSIQELAYALYLQHHIDQQYIQSLYNTLYTSQWCHDKTIQIETSIDIYKLLEQTHAMYDCIHCITSLLTQQRQIDNIKHLNKLITAEHHTPLLCGRRQELLSYLSRIDCTLFVKQIHWSMSMVNTVYECSQAADRVLLYTQVYQEQNRQFHSIDEYIAALCGSHREYQYIHGIDSKIDYIQISELINSVNNKLFFEPLSNITDVIPQIIDGVQIDGITHTALITHITLQWIKYLIHEQYVFDSLDDMILYICELQPTYNQRCMAVLQWLNEGYLKNSRVTEYNIIDALQLVYDSGAMLQTLTLLQEFEHSETRLNDIQHTVQVLRYHISQQHNQQQQQLYVTTQQLYAWFQSQHCCLLQPNVEITLEHTQQLLHIAQHAQNLQVLLQHIQLSGQRMASYTQLQHTVRTLHTNSYHTIKQLQQQSQQDHSHLFHGISTQYERRQQTASLYYNSLAGPLTASFLHAISITHETTIQQLTQSIKSQFLHNFDIYSITDIVPALDITEQQIIELSTVLTATNIIPVNESNAVSELSRSILLNSIAGCYAKHHINTFAEAGLKFNTVQQCIHTINVRHQKLHAHKNTIISALLKPVDDENEQHLFHPTAYIQFDDSHIYDLLDAVCGDTVQLLNIIERARNKSRQFFDIEQLVQHCIQRYNPELTPEQSNKHSTTYTAVETSQAHGILIYLLNNDNKLVTDRMKQQLNKHDIVQMIQQCELGEATFNFVQRLHGHHSGVDSMQQLTELLKEYKLTQINADNNNQHIAELSVLTSDQLDVYTYMNTPVCMLLDNNVLQCTVEFVQQLFEQCLMHEIMVMYIQLLNNDAHRLHKFTTIAGLADVITTYHSIHHSHVTFELVDHTTYCTDILCNIWLWLISIDGQLLLPQLNSAPTLANVEAIHNLMKQQTLPYLQSMLQHGESFVTIDSMLLAIQNRATLYEYIQQQYTLIDTQLASSITDQQLRYMLKLTNDNILALAVYCMHMQIRDEYCTTIDQLYNQMHTYAQHTIQWQREIYALLTIQYKTMLHNDISITEQDALDICIISTAGPATLSCLAQLYNLQQSYTTVQELTNAVKHIFELRLKQRRINRTLLLDTILSYSIVNNTKTVQLITDKQLQQLFGMAVHNEPYRTVDVIDYNVADNGLSVLHRIQQLAEAGVKLETFHDLVNAVYQTQQQQ